MRIPRKSVLSMTARLLLQSLLIRLTHVRPTLHETIHAVRQTRLQEGELEKDTVSDYSISESEYRTHLIIRAQRSARFGQAFAHAFVRETLNLQLAYPSYGTAPLKLTSSWALAMATCWRTEFIISSRWPEVNDAAGASDEEDEPPNMLYAEFVSLLKYLCKFSRNLSAQYSTVNRQFKNGNQL